MGFFIGIDSGTQGTKSVVIDESGGVLASSSASYGLIEGLPPGNKEQHPEQWISAVKKTILEALGKSKVNPKEAKAIGVSGQQHGFVPLDSNGKVIRPAKLWNDTSTAEEVKQLQNSVGGKEKLIELSGNAVPVGFTAPKILWLKNNEPENFGKLGCVLLPHDFINYWLTGEKKMECGDASGTGLLDVRKREWCNPVIEAIDKALPEKLPKLAASEKPAGVVKEELVKEFGFGNEVIVSTGGGDNMMSAIGTGNTKPGIVTASLGTSGTIFAFSTSPVIDPKGECAAFCDSTGNWLPLFCTMNVTVATEMAKNAFGLGNEQLTDAIGKVPAGSNGLVLLPYFEGERTPNYPHGTGVFFGVNNKTFSKECFSRAAMEGATLGMNYCLNRLRELGINPSEIRLTGGGAKNPAWRQVAADVFNTEVVCLQEEESAALGAAIQALWCFKNFKGESVSISELTDKMVKLDESKRAKPIQKNVKVYQKLQAIQDRMAPQLDGLFESHRKMLTGGG